MLLVVLSSAGQFVPADPDLLSLQQERLIEIDAVSSDGAGFRVTPAGIELIGRLGLRKAPT
ncbi:hypothetical protein PPGU19_092200 (plasmid) [Paraburkholderia sp. PGU19]|nr:hypothetical protein PPGU19_092200 [Paraburkholderia sp. PGU19]